MADKPLQITPDTKIGQLLQAYPQLEEILMEMAPAFRNLRNPILRKTVAKVTSIRQAARVGGVSLGAMVNRLRQEIGQSAIEAGEENIASKNEGADSEILSFLPGDLYKSLDAREMIESGEQPLGKVMSDLRKLPRGAVYELITPFEPAPLIDQAKSQGFKAISRKSAGDIFRTYFKHVDD